MILSFTFSNVFSFKDKQVISFEPEPLKELPEHLVRYKKYGQNPESFLRTLAIYGHNSHGKSNILKTFNVFTSLIEQSFKNPKALSEIEPFALNTSTINKPSYFEIVIIEDDVKYKYGFEATSEKIIGEWFYHAPYATKESNLFTRVEQEFRISRLWSKESDLKIETQLIPFAVPNVLLFSVLAAQQNEKVLKVVKAINSIIVISESTNLGLLFKSASIFSNETYASKVQKFIDDADLGFKTIFDKIEKKINESNKFDEKFLKEILYERSVQKFELFTYHKIYDEYYTEKNIAEFDFLKKESEGSIKFFIITCILVYAIENNLLLFIDELDSKFHSDLLTLIINKFHSPSINGTESQLIFTSHNTVLLNKQLRRDQILFVEKNDFGESSLKPMHTRKTPVRIDASIEKDYRKGKLGGVSKKIQKNNPNQASLFD